MRVRFSFSFKNIRSEPLPVLLPIPTDRPGQQVRGVSLSFRPVQSQLVGEDLFSGYTLGPKQEVSIWGEARLEPVGKPGLAHLAELLEEAPEDSARMVSEWAKTRLELEGYLVRRAVGVLLDGKLHHWLEVWHEGAWLPLDPWAFLTLKRDPGALIALGVTDPQIYLGGHEGRRIHLGQPHESWEALELEATLEEGTTDLLLSTARLLALGSVGLNLLNTPVPPLAGFVAYGFYLLLLALRQGRTLFRVFRRRPTRALEPLFFHAFALSCLFHPEPALGLIFLLLFAYHRWPRPPA
ncbi:MULTISPECIES: hypothetical protein [unclassified Meiothermus]|uniref:hypothetical protein n=1 Tax=unclassified Meiothermus TaxID=370471 RepID=UPI000D7CC889|nr:MULTISPECIES: hypothetical protein [unclassified Meiothermus]PZA07740.1 hypothetical protein DNA98_05375 [Meiothermus sp. Pnk-1]RYM35355.1 hypothetical protein EWH23_11700 [Meiothermus sp. PNK-Is4]